MSVYYESLKREQMCQGFEPCPPNVMRGAHQMCQSLGIGAMKLRRELYDFFFSPASLRCVVDNEEEFVSTRAPLCVDILFNRCLLSCGLTYHSYATR